MKKRLLVIVAVLVLTLMVGVMGVGAHQRGHGNHPHEGATAEDAKGLTAAQQGMPSIRGPFDDTSNMEFLGQVTTEELGVNRLANTGAAWLSDLWGWTSPAGQEYAIVGTSAGPTFVRITDPRKPV